MVATLLISLSVTLALLLNPGVCQSEVRKVPKQTAPPPKVTQPRETTISDVNIQAVFKTGEELFKQGKIHPLDLKNSVIENIEKMVKPVREHFEKDRKAREMLEAVNKIEVTR
jgi:tyrosyl-tRNA synthetase